MQQQQQTNTNDAINKLLLEKKKYKVDGVIKQQNASQISWMMLNNGNCETLRPFLKTGPNHVCG